MGPLALKLPGAQYIETGDGYLAKSERVLDLIVERAIEEMQTSKEGLEAVRAEIRAKAPKAPRDPRVFPRVGDIVRITYKDQVQLREVTKTAYDDDDETTAWIWWKPYEGNGGSKLFLKSWRKLCKGGVVVKAARG